MRGQWLEAINKAFPEGHAAGFPGYPLLGDEVSQSEAAFARWELRLTLVEPFEDAILAALTEDVQEVRLRAAAQALAPSFMGPEPDGPELFLDQEVQGCWTLAECKTVSRGPLSGERRTWRCAEQTRLEECLKVDGQVLRNLADLRRLKASSPDVDRWVVRSAASGVGETEELIAETLAYWTGAVAGADVLEVEQQPGESFETLWARLSICRLLRWEAELAQPGDACAGAGLFSTMICARALQGDQG